MSAWVLLAVMFAGFSSSPLQPVDFFTREACQAALLALQSEAKGKLNGAVIGVCVHRGDVP